MFCVVSLLLSQLCAAYMLLLVEGTESAAEPDLLVAEDVHRDFLDVARRRRFSVRRQHLDHLPELGDLGHIGFGKLRGRQQLIEAGRKRGNATTSPAMWSDGLQRNS